MKAFVNPSGERWQTTRFSVFKRQSRVEVDAQKDLEDMLKKLEEKPDDAVEDNNEIKSREERRKLLRLVIPCGALAVICLVYCLVGMSVSGSGIVGATELSVYHNRLNLLQDTVDTVLQEYSARLATNLRKSERSVHEYVYRKTDDLINKILTTRTMTEWRLISRINDWRNEPLIQQSFIIEETNFYMNFLLDLQTLIISEELDFKEVYLWKHTYEYNVVLQKTLGLQILSVLVNNIKLIAEHVCLEHFPNGASSEYTTLFLKIQNLMNQDNNVFDQFRSENRSISYTLQLLSAFETYLFECDGDKNTRWRNKIMYICEQGKHEQFNIYESLTQYNSQLLSQSVLIFCLHMLNFAITCVCSYLFYALLRNELRLSAIVSDWFSQLQVRVDEQKESTFAMLSKVVPRTLLSRYETNQCMIPYTVSETTLFMSSIAAFESLLDYFTPAQALNILTFVLELLDERIAQYNVFPVARCADCVVVISDNAKKRQVQHACEMANMAVDIMTCCSDLEIGRNHTTKLCMKVALHSGPCSGRLLLQNGTVRLKLLGQSLDILQHIHEAASPNMIHLSEPTYRYLDTSSTYSLHYRGNINIKGDCSHRVYWLNGRRVSSASASNADGCYTRMGSWVELEKKPLYRLDELEGTYEPLNKGSAPRHPELTIGPHSVLHT
ncbi:uncharacterized protein LOC128246072 [Mya arenaria]|uniref:uncharacterized protein LOC128246072 n=1 Tax=Mya arenaria TaxID=6604 RepID=UPI0022E84870|nr:uncharacterized protein LOC128246072 [Mya arenaria]